MSGKQTDVIKGHSVIAITQEDDVFKAVCLSKKSGSLNLVWTKSCDVDRMDWPAFIAECLPESGDEDRKAAGRNRTIVVGFNSIGVVFYRLEIPAVREDEIERIIRLQTESKLPLPAEQIEIAYRTAVDLTEQSGSPMDSSAADRFVQDIRSVFELFGFADESKVPVYVFAKSVSDKTDKKALREFEIIENIVSVLASAGFNATLCDFRFPVSNYLLSTDDNECLYEYRVPIGLGLMSLDLDKELALFDSLYRPTSAEKKKHWLYSLKAACSVTIMMLILSVIAFYLLDAAQLAHLNELKTRVDYGSLMAKHNLMEIVAAQRPDVLELLSQLSSVEANGIMLSDIDFKMGQAVKIKGTAGNAEQLYKFQENLLADENFKEVGIQSPREDEKTKKLNFTIIFNFKNLSQKRG